MRRLHSDLHRVGTAGGQVRDGGLHLVLLRGSRFHLKRRQDKHNITGFPIWSPILVGLNLLLSILNQLISEKPVKLIHQFTVELIPHWLNDFVTNIPNKAQFSTEIYLMFSPNNSPVNCWLCEFSRLTTLVELDLCVPPSSLLAQPLLTESGGQ